VHRVVTLSLALVCALVAVGGLTLLGAGRLGPALAQEASPAASPAADCPTTTEEENEALARRHVELLHTGVDAYDEILAPDYVHHRSTGSTEYDGPEAFKAAVQRVQDGVDATDLTIEVILSDGDLVTVAWTDQLTQTGEFFGAPATGRTATWEATDIFRIACGRIAETWASGDSLGLLRQFGIISDDELAGVETPSPGTVTP
jgi:steroid delta-isomerase-like uncharacterized protein